MRALVIGNSGGIGAALAAALAARGEVVGLSRSRDGLDLTDEDSIRAAFQKVTGPFDLVFVATGALGRPEKTLKTFDPAAFAAQVSLNAAGPMLALKHALPMLPRDRRVVFAALSARVGSIGDNRLGGWYSYRAAKAALNQLLHSAAVELARTHPQAVIAALHPGTVATRFTEGYGGEKLTPAESAARLLSVLDGLTPAQSGGFFDHKGETVPW